MGKIGIRFREALVGEGAEVAHIDLIIGDKDGPAGVGFSFGLAHQSYGHTKLFAVLTPNLLVNSHTLSPKSHYKEHEVGRAHISAPLTTP